MLTRPNVLLENAEITFLCTLSSRVEEEEGAKSFPGDNADESRTHIVGKCELHTGRNGMCLINGGAKETDVT